MIDDFSRRYRNEIEMLVHWTRGHVERHFIVSELKRYLEEYGGVIGYINTIGTKQFVAECDELAEQFGVRFVAPDMLRKMADKDEAFYTD